MFNYNKSLIFYIVQLVIVIILGVYLLVNGQWKLETNLLALLPHSNSQQTQQIEATEQALFHNKQNQIMVLIQGEQAQLAYQQLQQTIKQFKTIKAIQNKFPNLEELSKFYLPYQHNFLSTSYRQNINNPTAITQLITQQLTQVSNPFVSETLTSNPQLNLASYMQELINNMGAIIYQNGIATINYHKKNYLIAQFQLQIDGFSLNKSQKVSTQLQQLFTHLTKNFNVEIHYSGIIFHTAASSTQAKYEISLFGTLSLIAVILLIIFTFRSLYPLITSLSITFIASFYGITATLLFFKTFHILTFVFATTLIGIVIDYCFHFFVFNSHTKQHSFKSLSKPLLLGFITTALGYFALLFSPLTLLSQVAVFMIFGLLAALLTVLLCLPNIKRYGTIKLHSKADKLSQQLQYWLFKPLHFKKVITAFLSAVIVLILLWQPLSFNDDVRLLNSSPQFLLDQEKATANIFQQNTVTRLMVHAASLQLLLEQQEHIIQQLQSQQPSLTIQSIVNFLPSIKQQQQNFALLHQATQQGVFKAAEQLTGLTIQETQFIPLTFEHFKQGPLAFVAKNFIVKQQVNNHTFYAAWLEVSHDKLNKTNQTWITKQNNVFVFDKANEISNTLSVYRQNILILLLIAFVISSLILIGKYGFAQGGFATSITIMSGLIALLSSQLITGHLNIFNLLALLLILALAIDYVIFYQEHGINNYTCLAISLSALSSAFVFGMLIFSKTPAVYSFGLTVMIGIFAIFILAPLVSKDTIINMDK